jgi:N-alpha-acetyltransferase 30
LLSGIDLSLTQWTESFLQAHQQNVLVGVVIAKLEKHRVNMRGYIAMLAVQAEHRGRGIGNSCSRVSAKLSATVLVESALSAMITKGADEVLTQTM